MKLLIVVFLVCSSFHVYASEVTISYLKNDGVLIKSENIRMVADSMFLNMHTFLDHYEDSEFEPMKKGEGRFADLDLILVSHTHEDHYDAKLVGEHLIRNSKTRLLGPEAMRLDMVERFSRFDEISERVLNAEYELGVATVLLKSPIRVTAYPLSHFGIPVADGFQNVAFLVEIEGKRIIHFGDSDVTPENLALYDFSEMDLDVAILPYWRMNTEEYAALVKERISADVFVAAHVPLASVEESSEVIEALFDNAVVFVEGSEDIVLE